MKKSHIHLKSPGTKKIQKFEKVTSRVKMRNGKNPLNLKIIFLKSCIVSSSVNYRLITFWHVKNEVSVRFWPIFS
jgi:hypothetical protein